MRSPLTHANVMAVTAVLLLASAAPASSQLSGYPEIVLADSPVAYWRLEEASGTQAADSSGNANDGTYQGDPALGEGGVIGEGAAPSFDGTNDGVRVPEAVTISGANPLTLEAWVQTTDADGPVVAHRSSTSPMSVISLHLGYQGWGNGGTGRPTLIVRDGADGVFCRHVMISSVAVNDGLPHHIVATRNSSKQWTLYVDGVDRASMTDTVSSVGPLDLSAIGMERFWLQAGFTTIDRTFLGGKVDEVALYDRALSPERIQAHFQAGATGTGPIPPEQSTGTCSGTGTHAISGSSCQDDPVNSLTGAFTTGVTDLRLPGIGVPFTWRRSYTSVDPTAGRLGPGWTDSYATSLEIEANGDVVLRGDEGQQVRYAKQPNGSFDGASGARSTLTQVAGGYELVRRDQVTYAFDATGRLTAMRDRNEQGLSFAYDGSGQLQTITDSVGREITLTHAAGLVSRVTLPDGRFVEYGHTTGRLTSVRDAAGGITQYTYDAGGRLKTVVDQNGHTVVDNTYGAEGRVVQQVNARSKVGTFSWNASTQTQTYTDARQNQWRDVYQDDLLVARIDPLGNETRFEYDADLNVTKITDARGNASVMTYDARGNLITRTAPAPLSHVEEWTYSVRNDPLTYRDDAGASPTSPTTPPATSSR